MWSVHFFWKTRRIISRHSFKYAHSFVELGLELLVRLQQHEELSVIHFEATVWPFTRRARLLGRTEAIAAYIMAASIQSEEYR